MRVTNQMIHNNAVRHMRENLEKLYAAQELVASGKAFQRASDDPSTASAALLLRSTLEASQDFLDGAAVSREWIDANEVVLGQLSDLATRAVTLAQSGISDTQGADERQTLGTEMDGLLEAAVEAANTTHQGGYLFAGFRIRTKPFELVGGTPDNVVYSGDAGVIRNNLGPGQSVTVNLDASAVFSPFFSALIAARDALNADDSAALQTAAADLRTSMEGIVSARTTNGARGRMIDDASESLERSQLAIKALLSKKEDVDMAEAISLVRQQETVYQAVLESGQRAISTPNLFDYLG